MPLKCGAGGRDNRFSWVGGRESTRQHRFVETGENGEESEDILPWTELRKGDRDEPHSQGDKLLHVHCAYELVSALVVSRSELPISLIQ